MTEQTHGFIELFAAKAKRCPENVFARLGERAIRFSEIMRDASTLAAHLRQLGIGQGGRVAVMMDNSPASIVVVHALALAGIVWVPVNIRQRGAGLAYVLEHCSPAAILCDEAFLPVIHEAGANVDRTCLIVTGDMAVTDARSGALSLRTLLSQPLDFDTALPSGNDLFAIMYTSGTTGRPKGVLVTHAMMRLAGEAVALVTNARAGDILFMWEPLFHIGGAQVLVLPALMDVSLTMVDRFSATRFWQQVRTSGATHVHYLGGVLQILLKQPPSATDREHAVRIFWGGGCKQDIWRQFEDRFGVEIRECYGMTEASSITTLNDSGTIGSVGRPLPWFSVEVCDGAGSTVPAGEKGEIVIRSNRDGAIFKGYYLDPVATSKALRGGRFHTGDMGALDADGNLRFHGRLTDSVRVRGENVSAWEVEHVATSHPSIEDCAMIGVDADVGEQDIKLFVKLKPGQRLELPAFANWLAARLASFQMPRYFALVSEFQRTPSERIMKHTLCQNAENDWALS